MIIAYDITFVKRGITKVASRAMRDVVSFPFLGKSRNLRASRVLQKPYLALYELGLLLEKLDTLLFLFTLKHCLVEGMDCSELREHENGRHQHIGTALVEPTIGTPS